MSSMPDFTYAYLPAPILMYFLLRVDRTQLDMINLINAIEKMSSHADCASYLGMEGRARLGRIRREFKCDVVCQFWGANLARKLLRRPRDGFLIIDGVWQDSTWKESSPSQDGCDILTNEQVRKKIGLMQASCSCWHFDAQLS